MRAQWRPAALCLLWFTVLTGAVYPLCMTAVARVFFPWKSAGSMVRRDGGIVGSALIGQPFSDPGYFWGRPSATAGMPYNAAASSGSNYGPLHPGLHAAAQARIAALRRFDPADRGPVPVDLVTASGSGLDPDISAAGAFYQAGRVARSRGLPESRVSDLVRQHVRSPSPFVFGGPVVNVLDLNLALDGTPHGR